MKLFPLKLLSLAAALLGAVGLMACGGGAASGGSTLLLDAPVLAAPPPGSNLPDPIPLPPEGGGNPVDEQPPANEEPPAETPPEQPPVVPTPPAPDLAHVSAMAVVGENAAVAETPESYVGLYVAEEGGAIWRRLESGDWKQVGAVDVVGTVEAMTYVRSKHALYLAIETLNGRQLLARWLLTLTPEVWDFGFDPPALVDEGGVQLQILENTAGQLRLDGVSRVTGLAFDTAQDRLYAWDQPNRSLVRIADLDVAEATFERQINLTSGLLSDVQDMAYDRDGARLLLLDATAATVIELDHLGLAFHAEVTLPYADLRALAWEEAGTRLAIDRATASLVRFDVNGAVQ